jgi:hypothetical protein
VLLQIFGFVNFFALFGATFLFRSGLFNLLYRQFRPLLWIHPLYILATIVLGVLRVVRSGLQFLWQCVELRLPTRVSSQRKVAGGQTLLDVWDDNVYAVLSCTQKMGTKPFSTRMISSLSDGKESA